MCAVARDLDLSLRVFAALAAVRLVIRYGAPASGMRAFRRFSFWHEVSLRSLGVTRFADLNYAPAATHQVEHQNYQGHDQEQMDQAPADAKAEP